MDGIHTGIDSLVVHLNDCVTLLGVGLLCCLLHEGNRLIDRHYVSQLEECGLKDRVGTLAHTDLDSLVDSVDSVKLDIVISDILLCLSVQMLLKLFI